MVYFIHAEGTNLVKIGYTSGAAAARMAELQTGSPHQLAMLYAVTTQDDPTVERIIHEKFSASRVRGEWFLLTVELRDFITRQMAIDFAAAHARLYAIPVGDDPAGRDPWVGFLDELRGYTPTLADYLRLAVPPSLGGSHVVIRFPPDRTEEYRFCSLSPSRKALQSAFATILDRTVTVDVVLLPESP